MTKRYMFCDQCKKTIKHKQNLFRHDIWQCIICGEERTFKRDKSNWYEEFKERRQREIREQSRLQKVQKAQKRLLSN